MKADGNTVKEILERVPADRKAVFEQLHQTILTNLPKGFEPANSYGGLGYVVPHTIYPDGYHCKPSEPLPFAGIASQKNTINFYHMGLYAHPDLHNWFVESFTQLCNKKPDMGKSCIRFKKTDQIPFALIGELMQKITVADWIAHYDSHIKKSKRKS